MRPVDRLLSVLTIIVVVLLVVVVVGAAYVLSTTGPFAKEVATDTAVTSGQGR